METAVFKRFYFIYDWYFFGLRTGAFAALAHIRSRVLREANATGLPNYVPEFRLFPFVMSLSKSSCAGARSPASDEERVLRTLLVEHGWRSPG